MTKYDTCMEPENAVPIVLIVHKVKFIHAKPSSRHSAAFILISTITTHLVMAYYVDRS